MLTGVASGLCVQILVLRPGSRWGVGEPGGLRWGICYRCTAASHGGSLGFLFGSRTYPSVAASHSSSRGFHARLS